MQIIENNPDLYEQLLRELAPASVPVSTIKQVSNSTRPLTPEDPGPTTENTATTPSSKDPRDSVGQVEERIFGDKWEALDFKTPVELLAFLHPAINSHQVVLHPWQVEIGESLGHAKPNSLHPHKFCLCAANGSGKDAFVIAPFAIWFITTKIRSLVVITSASGVQLSHQTENYIRSLGTLCNNFFKPIYGKDILKINQRSIKCSLSGSEIVMFSTDEEGRAEGYHPLEPNAEMAIIVNEAKSVPPPIFRALRRCTGYNYWLNVSTPGEPNGDFYNSFVRWPHKRRVTYYDCPHQSPDEFEADRIELGEHSLLFRSKWLALFTSVSGNTVISQLAIEKLRNKLREKQVKWIGKDWKLRVGIDLAAGGDETVVSIWRGNCQIAQECFREEDTTVTADKIEQILIKHKLDKTHEHMFADDGGIGRAIIQMLKKRGWNIKRVLNNSAAKHNKKDYRNRGMELWYKVGRLIELCYLIPLEDEKLWSQLGSRHYKALKESAVTKLQLESKHAEMAEGFKSPDRADAMVLAFTDVTVDQMMKAIDGFIEHNEETDSKRITADQLQIQVEDMMYKGQLHDNINSLLANRFRSSRTSAVGNLRGSVKSYTKGKAFKW